jgi:hypothetical protein
MFTWRQNCLSFLRAEAENFQLVRAENIHLWEKKIPPKK